MMGGDFNARTGGGEPVGDQERRKKKREKIKGQGDKQRWKHIDKQMQGKRLDDS